MNKIVCLLLVVQSVLVDILSLKQIIIFLHFVPPIFCTVLSIAQSSGVPGPLAWWLVTSVPRARTQISNVTIIHVGYSQGEPGPGWEEGGGGFLLLSTFLLVALMSYQILLLCGASPGQPSSQTRSILSLKNDQFPLVASPENKIIFRAYLRALK